MNTHLRFCSTSPPKKNRTEEEIKPTQRWLHIGKVSTVRNLLRNLPPVHNCNQGIPTPAKMESGEGYFDPGDLDAWLGSFVFIFWRMLLELGPRPPTPLPLSAISDAQHFELEVPRFFLAWGVSKRFGAVFRNGNSHVRIREEDPHATMGIKNLGMPKGKQHTAQDVCGF